MANILEIILKTIKQGTGFGDTEQEAGKLQGTLNGLNQVLGYAGLAIGAKQLFDFGKAAEEAARAQKDALGILQAAVPATVDYADALRLASEQTNNMASKTQLASSLGVIFGAGLATDAQQAAQLASAGTVLSNVFASAGASQEMYVRLLSSGSIQLYNNFGITQAMVAANQKEIEATTNLTGESARLAAVKQTLIDNANKYKQAMSDDTVAAAQFSAASDDMQAALGALILPQVTESMQNIGGAIRGLAGAGQELPGPINATAKAVIDLANPLTILNSLIRDYHQLTGDTAAVTGDAAGSMDQAKAAAEAEQAALGPLTSSLDAMGFSAKGAAEGQDPVIQKLNEARFAADQAAEAFQHTAAAEQSIAQAGAFGGQADSFTQQRRIAGMQAADDMSKASRDKQAKDAADLANEQEREGKRAASAMEKSFKSAADNIASAIEGAIQPTLSEVWKPPAGAEQHVDEAARQLATVATSGFGSDFLTKLGQQFSGQSFWKPIAAAAASGDEGALKAAATQTLVQFQQGLIPQLYNVEQIKAQVRQQLQQQRIKEQLIEEVKKELGAEGVTQAVGAVEVAAGNVKVAQATVATGATDMAAAAKDSGADVGKSWDQAISKAGIYEATLRRIIGLTDTWASKTKAGVETFYNVGAGAALMPTDAQKKNGGVSGL